MRKLLVVVLGCTFSLLIHAQSISPNVIDTNHHYRGIYLEGFGDISSSAISNDILKPFLFGGEISDEVIQRNALHQKSLNRAGAVLFGNLMYRDLKTNLFKSEKLGFGVQIGYDRLMNISYTDQLFGLVFQGNEQYAGQNIKLNSTSISDVGFQKVGFGVFLKNTQSYGFLNIVNVSDYMKGGVKHGTIQQSEDLDHVIFDLAGNFSHTNSSSFSKGMGLSIDFKYNIPVKLFKNSTAVISAQIRNLGFAAIYEGTTRYSIDTIQNYQGFSFNQLMNGVISKGTSIMDTLGVKEEKGAKVIGLPFYVQVSKEVNSDYEGQIQSLFGLRVYPIANFRPLIYLGLDYRPVQNLHLGLLASYGGFTTFRANLYVQYRIKNFGFGLSAEDLVGIFTAKYSYGQAYNLRLLWEF